MNEKKIPEIEEISSSFLQTGSDIIIEIIDSNWIQKIGFKLGLLEKEKKFTIYPISLGTLVKISSLLLELKVIRNENTEKEEFFGIGLQEIVENKDRLLQIIGHGILNVEKNPSRKFLKFLNNNLTSTEVLKLVILIVRKMDVSSFLACTASVQSLNLLKAEE